ncbi:hypothetical protein NSE_0907 [Neorickettsia sennetsu str. Miyayama]|uniref:Uncharacterized protein n=1 Tax=Ehrlichia sennetsu (strain ATCC VR-367 / Miyayama) TaxID=222891 RepID=Q2GCM4_EHRS3|nr:hypothetical protein NSE_0907 [Neorickettsia sennetsu str. Miyayama]
MYPLVGVLSAGYSRIIFRVFAAEMSISVCDS